MHPGTAKYNRSMNVYYADSLCVQNVHQKTKRKKRILVIAKKNKDETTYEETFPLNFFSSQYNKNSKA